MDKRYRVEYSGGIEPFTIVRAPNKTIARQIAKGELNPWCKITKIVEEPIKCYRDALN